MVKADPQRNYYEDLEVQPDANDDEIRKQFRKLALKYHPDRNPGKEEDVVPRFQAIQAANEILSDPRQRAKYDADRKKQTTYGVSNNKPAASARNPYTHAPSNYPPPPRRTEPTKKPRPQPQQWETWNSARPTRPTGADRFTNFARAAPTAQRPGAKEGPDARGNMFTAWQSMNPKGRPQPPPPPPPSDEQFARAKNAREQQSGYGESPNLGRSNTTRTPRKTGFDPATPGADEPPAGGTSAYYTSSRYSRQPPPPPPPSDPRREMHPPPNLRRDVPPPPTPPRPQQFYEDPRTRPEQTNFFHAKPSVADATGESVPGMRPRMRAPYAGTSGERTAFSSDGLKRASSTRNSPRDPNSPMQDPHSFSSSFKSRPRSASPGSRKAFDSSPKTANTSKPRAHGGNATRPFFDLYSSSEEETASPQQARQSNDTAAGTTTHRESRDVNEEQSPNFNSQRRAQSHIFSMPAGVNETDARGSNFKRRSAENINTRFSPDDWHGKFQGNGDYFAAPVGKSSSRTRVSPTRGRPKSGPAAQQQSTQMPPPPPPPPPSDKDLQKKNSGQSGVQSPPVKFSAEEWHKTFKEPSFIYPPSSKGTSPVRSSDTTRRTKTAKSRKPVPEPKPATVIDLTDEPETVKEPGNKQEAGPRDADPMEIDEETPKTNGDFGLTPPQEEPPPSAKSGETPSEESLKVSMDSLQDAAPFTYTKNGLEQLSDLKSSIPFPSANSGSHPTKELKPQQLSLPPPPVAPKAPSNLSKITITDYITRFKLYLTEWAKFNKKMTEHFEARQQWVEDLGTEFIGQVGEMKIGGFGTYLKGLKEDERVRAYWGRACDGHRENIEEMGRWRDKVTKMTSIPAS